VSTRGVIGSNQTGAKSHGLHLHTTLAISSNGLPLGVLRAEFEAPAPKTTPATGRGDAADRKSYRWIESLRDCADLAATLPQTRLISVMDREADFFSLFEEQRRRPQLDLLVRAKHNRRLPNYDDKALRARLFDTLRTAPIQGQMQLSVARQSIRLKRSKCPAKPGRKARTATAALRHRQVTFESTLAERAGIEQITLWVMHVREETPPQGALPLEWFLLTTVVVPFNEQAQQILDWYCLRWRIEDWHRVLKSGCKTEELAHHSAERIKRDRHPHGHRLAHHADDPAWPRDRGRPACRRAVLGHRTQGTQRLRHFTRSAGNGDLGRRGALGRHPGRLRQPRAVWPWCAPAPCAG